PPRAGVGAGPASEFSTREECIRASQDHQASLLRLAIERLRALKFTPCGGVLVFQLVDPFPGITPAVVDHARRKKRAYRVLAEATEPAAVLAEPILRFQADGVYRLFAELEAADGVLATVDQRFAVGSAEASGRVRQDAGPADLRVEAPAGAQPARLR